MQKLLDDLNPPQREAVTHPSGPLLILAGAGSGKTRVLTYRIAHLIAERGVPAEQVLAVTFTNKAADEMRARIRTILGVEKIPLVMSTFHSFCARLLRREAELLGFPRTFSIYDDDDQVGLLKHIIEDLQLQNRQLSAAGAQNQISLAKNRLQSPADFAADARPGSGGTKGLVAQIFAEYQKRLQQQGAMDFDDLLVKVVELFRRHPERLAYYQNHFAQILVDEYQDTNHAQYLLVKFLAEKHRNLAVVGDDDQSIYRWRGADLRNILEFERDFPDARVVKLEQNYRSPQVILDAAWQVVSRNTGRKEKKLWTDREGGEKISLTLTFDDRMESRWVAEEIARRRAALDLSFSDFVVLFRTNAQSRLLEDALRDRGFPYVIVGGVRFYQRREVKDVIAYLRVLANPRDDTACLRILNVPRRGIGAATEKKLIDLAREKNLPLFELLATPELWPRSSPKIKKELQKLSAFLTDLKPRVAALPVAELIETIVMRTGLVEELQVEDAQAQESRAENVKELIAAAAEFADRTENPTVDTFLEEVTLLSDIDRWDDAQERITLMTLHQAKGLEFRVVFLAGMEEGLFPLSRSLADPDELEEERRLFYVGCTRAKEKLYLSACRHRRRFGEMTNLKSRFLDELPPEHLETTDLGFSTTISWEAAQRSARQVELIPEFDAVTARVKVGSRVIHPTWGQGKVLQREGSGENLRLLVQFTSGGPKKLLAKYANLEIAQY